MKANERAVRGLAYLALTVMFTAVPWSTLSELRAAQPCIPGYYFTQTQKYVCGRFYETWLGGRSFAESLYINGLPLTSVIDQQSEYDGLIYRTQWFERARFEAHPENQPPYDVLLGRLGVEAAANRSPAPFEPVANPGNGLRWFPETQHTVGDSSTAGQAIAAFWAQKGGIAQFGFPVSQPFLELTRETDPRVAGKRFLVQYFERQRFEYHPENAGTPFVVLLGRLGAEQMSQQPFPRIFSSQLLRP